MPRNGTDSVNTLKDEIRRQLGSPAMARFARSLPAFQVDHAMPKRLTSLLAELDEAEAGRINAGPNGKSH